MNWNFGGGASLSEMTQLLADPECKLEDVLLNSSLSQAIRNSNSNLISFVEKENILNELFDWALTEKYKEQYQFEKLTRGAVSILTTSSPQIQKAITSKDVFISRINGFMDNKNENTKPRLGGHFQRIVEQAVRTSDGEFLEKIQNLTNFLIHGMSIVGLRELFVTLVNEFSRNYKLTLEDVKELSLQASGENGYFVASACKAILRGKADEAIELFCHPEVVKNLLEAAQKQQNHVVAAEIYYTLNFIVEKLSNMDEHQEMKIEVEKLIDEYGNQFVTLTDVFCSTPPAISLFKKINKDVYLHIFQLPVNTMLNKSLIDVLEKDTENRKNLFMETDSSHKIIEAYDKTRSNAQLKALADFIKEMDNLPSEWESFMQRVEEDKKKLEDYRYGGELKEESSSDDGGYNGNGDFDIDDVSDGSDEYSDDEEEEEGGDEFDRSDDDDNSGEEKEKPEGEENTEGENKTEQDTTAGPDKEIVVDEEGK